MEKILLNKLSGEEERNRILKLRTLKEITLKCVSPDIKKLMTKIFDELVCEVVFQYHMELNISVANPNRYSRQSRTPDESLLSMAEELNVIKVNQDIDCPKCFVMVKCLWLSKHLAGCMNPHQSTYSYSSRNSSRIARQRIQEGFKTCYDESKVDSEDEKIRPKRRNNKGKKNKFKSMVK